MSAIRAGVLAAVALAALLWAAPAALAAGSWWHLDSGARPASIPSGGDGELVVTAENVGDGKARGPITVADALPSGLRATGIAGSAPKHGGALGEAEALSCSPEHLSMRSPGIGADRAV